jgi:hypothetical protein
MIRGFLRPILQQWTRPTGSIVALLHHRVAQPPWYYEICQTWRYPAMADPCIVTLWSVGIDRNVMRPSRSF